MVLRLRPFLICLVAYVVSLGLTLLALAMIVDVQTVWLQTEVPRQAMLTPMIAVVGFWGIARLLGVPLDPARTFLFGAIAIYAVSFFTGRVVALTQANGNLATLTAALVLFIACYVSIIQALNADDAP